MSDETNGGDVRKAPEQRIAEMVASGNVTPAQAEQLLKALPPPERRSPFMVLLDPSEHLSPAVSMVAFVVVLLVHVALTQAGISFDGALDSHLKPQAMGLLAGLAQVAIVMLGTTLLLWLAARAAGSAARLIDVAGVVAVMRAPMVLSALAVLWVGPGLTAAAPPMAKLGVMALVAVSMLVWQLLLLFRGMRWASSLTGARLWAVYLGGLLLAEALLVFVTRVVLV